MEGVGGGFSSWRRVTIGGRRRAHLNHACVTPRSRREDIVGGTRSRRCDGGREESRASVTELRPDKVTGLQHHVSLPGWLHRVSGTR